MAEHGLWQTTELIPLLAERGVELSAAQVYRLAAGAPERLSLRTLAALCDIFECTPNDLVETLRAGWTTPVRGQSQTTGGQTAPSGPHHARKPAMTGSACANGCGRRTQTSGVARWGAVLRWREWPCATPRSLPGLRAHPMTWSGGTRGKAPMCVRCSGITETLRCRTCGSDDDFRSLNRCRRCSLRARLERLFDDGSGRVNPKSAPFVDALGAIEVPRGGISWLKQKGKPASASVPSPPERSRSPTTASTPL